MDKGDIDTINRSLPSLTRLLDLNPRFLALLKEKNIFSQEMIYDIMVRKLSLYYYIVLEIILLEK